MNVSVRYIHSDIIKPSENGGLESEVDSATHKFLISDTALRSFIPPQLRKMTHKLRQVCGCELCILSKDIYTYLNRYRKILVTDLQHNYVGLKKK